MIYNWSKYRRKQNNLEKAEYNYLVNDLLTKHYRYLHSLLVKSESDESTFNDTYLKLTRVYSPDKDFIDQFKFQFNQLSGQYMKDDKCYNYAETKGEIYTDNIQLTDSEPEVTKPTLKTALINNIKEYALLEKAQKHKAQIGKKTRKTKHLSK